MGTWSKHGRRRLLATIKGLCLPIPRSLGYGHAEVTRGGVALDEVEDEWRLAAEDTDLSPTSDRHRHSSDED